MGQTLAQEAALEKALSTCRQSTAVRVGGRVDVGTRVCVCVCACVCVCVRVCARARFENAG